MKPEEPAAYADWAAVGGETRRAVRELLEIAAPRPGQILVVGCSTSEIQGEKIGSMSSEAIARQVFDGLRQGLENSGVFLAVQCCEHLNRALVVERAVMEQYGLEEVSVVPVLKAGGALAALAYREFAAPVVVESIAAHLGLDIGCTLIGMHLRRVAVPVRLAQRTIGRAAVVAARTRPRLIGGARAVYA